MNTHRAGAVAILVLAVVTLACSQVVAPSSSADLGPNSTAEGQSLFDETTIHEVALSMDQGAYESAIDAYLTSSDKEWIPATITIDGATYEQVGIRLKGNSSLRRIDATANPNSLPWLVDLDQFVDGQNHDGVVEFVVRSNTSASSLNEAVALELLERAGLASQDAAAVRFSVNGGDDVLRLVIENPDDRWMAERLGAEGALYKAESTGDYSYRGDDPNAYVDVFDQEAGRDNADLTPLIEFLEFINNADDATIAAEIEERIDVDTLATYLAMQELLDNFDDIDGPGNNSYLYYDSATEQFTIVPWDYNLAFGVTPGRGGQDGGFNPPDGSFSPPQGGEPPAGSFDPPPGFEPPGNGQGGQGGFPGFMGRSNVLVQRFLAVDDYAALVETKESELRAELYGGGVAQQVLDEWVALIEAGAGDLVDSETITAEADRIAGYL